MMSSPSNDRHGAAQEQAQALQAAQKALDANPDSIFLHVLVGEMLEAQGDLEAALAAFDAAHVEFRRQYPNLRTPPVYLLQKLAQLRAEPHKRR